MNSYPTHKFNNEDIVYITPTCNEWDKQGINVLEIRQHFEQIKFLPKIIDQVL